MASAMNVANIIIVGLLGTAPELRLDLLDKARGVAIGHELGLANFPITVQHMLHEQHRKRIRL